MRQLFTNEIALKVRPVHYKWNITMQEMCMLVFVGKVEWRIYLLK